MIALNTLISVAAAFEIPVIGVTPAIEMPLPAELLKQQKALENLSGFEPAAEGVGSPSGVMPHAKSIVAIALPYDLNPLKTSDPLAVCEVSAMSWGYDYHEIVREKLMNLANWLNNTGGFESLVFCDTGPLNDRYKAFKAGLGSFGRNQMLIHPEFGSAVVLGYLLTDAHIEPSEPSVSEPLSFCGQCRRCQDACPTGALTGAHDIVISRCISNLTQQKRPLRQEEAHAIGSHLYGCDLCQTVCPHNSGKIFQNALRAKSANRLNPFDVFSLDKRSFKNIYGHHGFSWRGLKTIQRNALFNLLNSGQPKLLKMLETYKNNGSLPLDVHKLLLDSKYTGDNFNGVPSWKRVEKHKEENF